MSFMTTNVNKKMFLMIKRGFRTDLMYYNTSGIVHYVCEKFPLHEIRKTGELYLDDEKRFLNRNTDSCRLSLNMSSEDTSIIRKVCKLLEETSFFEHNIYHATAINYMMFHLLVLNGMVELKDQEMSKTLLGLQDPDLSTSGFDDGLKMVIFD